MKGARILFLPPPARAATLGWARPMEALAAACRERGAQPIFHVAQPMSNLLRSRGYEVIPLDRPATPSGGGDIDSFYAACTALGFDEPFNFGRLLDEENEIVSATRPAAIVSFLRLSAPITAVRNRLPLISIASWSTDPRVHGRGDMPLDELVRISARRSAGLEIATAPELMASMADLKVAPTYPDFEPLLTGDVVFTGYLRRPGSPGGSAVPRVPDRLILVYGSSAPWSVERFVRRIGRTGEALGATMWCVTQPGGPVGRISNSCEFFSYLPFDELLSRASAVVSHGGQGTAIAALHHGVPTVAIPARHYERRYNAERLRDLGAGVVGETLDLAPNRLAALLNQALEENRRPAIERAQARLRTFPGAVAAADAIEGLLGRVEGRQC